MSRKKSGAEKTPPVRDLSAFAKSRPKLHGPGSVTPFKPGEKDFDPTPVHSKPGHTEDGETEQLG